MAMHVTNLTNQDYWFGPLHLPAAGAIDVDDTDDTSLYLNDDSVADAINTLYAASKIQVTGYALPFPRATGAPEVLHGDGSPEGIVYAGQGSIYLRRDNAALYQKATGIHVNTGWGTVKSSTFDGLLSAGPPSNPGDGDVWRALAVDTGDLTTTDGTAWTFRYNASSNSTYKWEFIGGSKLYLAKAANTSLASASWTDWLSQTIARAGEYEFALQGDYYVNSGLNAPSAGIQLVVAGTGYDSTFSAGGASSRQSFYIAAKVAVSAGANFKATIIENGYTGTQTAFWGDVDQTIIPTRIS